MSLKCVELTDDVFYVCLAHSLTTEKEEVMGLLLGDILVFLIIFTHIYLIARTERNHGICLRLVRVD
jgi:hypothetical protein